MSSFWHTWASPRPTSAAILELSEVCWEPEDGEYAVTMASNWYSTARKKRIINVSHVFRLFLVCVSVNFEMKQGQTHFW